MEKRSYLLLQLVSTRQDVLIGKAVAAQPISVVLYDLL